MSNEALQFVLGFVNVGGCCECGTPMILEREFHRNRKSDHKNFYCPNGHPQHFPQKTEEEKLREALAQKEKFLQNAQKRTEWAEQDARQAKKRAAAYKGQLTRVKNGVCPCCRRNFVNLRRHMATKHPGYMETEK
jgi:hypothetical protein